MGNKSAPGKRCFQEFISEYIPGNQGNIVDVYTGDILGQHGGLHHWTLGQSAKLNIDCHKYGKDQAVRS